MTSPFKKATRQQQKLKIAVTGPSGAGKTKGALQLAKELANGGTVAVIDTENGSASLYADQFEFDTLNLSPPYLSSKYLEAIVAAVDAGFAALVIDTISHQWEGDGGILQRKEDADHRGGNHFANWQPFTKEHNAFKSALLTAPIHIIATMRSKQAYQVEDGQGKKSAPKKMGLQPLQREGMEYEFTVNFDLQMDHKATASKDRTELFDGKLTDLLTGKAGEKLLAWLATAAPYQNGQPPKAEVSVLPKECPPFTFNEKGGFWALPELVDWSIANLAERLGFKKTKQGQYWTKEETKVEEMRAAFIPESVSDFPRALQPTEGDKALDSLLDGATK